MLFVVCGANFYAERASRRIELKKLQNKISLPAPLAAWPLEGEMQIGWFDSSPYPLEDMRPQVFVGRNFAKVNASVLQVPEDPKDWQEDDVLFALSVWRRRLVRGGQPCFFGSARQPKFESALRFAESSLKTQESCSSWRSRSVCQSMPRTSMRNISELSIRS